MKTSEDTCLIGVDGGGTSCRVALVWGTKRFDARLGAANAATDRAGAIAMVGQAIAQVVRQAGLDPDRLARARVHVALAGIMDGADRRDVAVGLGKRLARAAVTVSDDRVSTLTGALGDGDGMVAGIGTGSFLAAQSGGRMRFVGGWGPVLGDEASGAWLGRGLLSASLRVADGLEQASELTEATRQRYGTPADIVEFGASASPGVFAALAPLVVAAAGAGDPVARGLMQGGAGYILRGLRVLGWTAGVRVCLTGGLGAPYRPWLADQLVADLYPPKGSALDGALHLAARAGEADG